MSHLLYSPAATADLDSIWAYTLERWGATQAARYVRDLDMACRELAADARPSRAIDDIRPGYRKANVGSHMVFFTRNDAGVTLIVRILHQRMDVESRLPSDA